MLKRIILLVFLLANLPGISLADTVDIRGITKGQKTMANSLPFTFASDQSALPVTGTFWQATQPVSGTFWQATQPVSMASNNPVGSVAHDSADSQAPLKIGCHARITNRAAVADADRSDVHCDKNGRILTTLAQRERVVRSGVVTLTNTTETTLIASGGANVFRDITYLKCTNNSATLVRVDIRDATAGTVIDSWALAASGGGFNLTFPVPYAQATANNNWTVQLSASVTDVRCSAQAIENN